LLVDPARHQEVDGSNTVKSVKATSGPVALGATFDMHMKRGARYSTRNTIIEFEPGKVIAWQTRPLTIPVRWLIGGRIWTYELTPEATGTRVRETWDLRPERGRRLVRRLAGDVERNMTATLAAIERALIS
jgi:hypothetical protein